MEDWNCVSRNRLPAQCPLGAIALWLAWRFYVDKEPFPRLDLEKIDWYAISDVISGPQQRVVWQVVTLFCDF